MFLIFRLFLYLHLTSGTFGGIYPGKMHCPSYMGCLIRSTNTLGLVSVEYMCVFACNICPLYLLEVRIVWSERQYMSCHSFFFCHYNSCYYLLDLFGRATEHG